MSNIKVSLLAVEHVGSRYSNNLAHLGRLIIYRSVEVKETPTDYPQQIDTENVYLREIFCSNELTLLSCLRLLSINNTTIVATAHWSSAHAAGCPRIMLCRMSLCVAMGGRVVHGRRCFLGWYYPGCIGCGEVGGNTLCGTGKHTCDPLLAFLHALCSTLIHTLINRLIFAWAAIYTPLNPIHSSADKADSLLLEYVQGRKKSQGSHVRQVKVYSKAPFKHTSPPLFGYVNILCRNTPHQRFIILWHYHKLYGWQYNCITGHWLEIA